MNTPRRIQRSRTKGWRIPEGAVVVSRPSRYGNPYVVDKDGGNITQDQAVALFRDALLQGRLQFGVHEVRRELAGKDLVCWCPPTLACHASVLLEIANDRATRPEPHP